MLAARRDMIDLLGQSTTCYQGVYVYILTVYVKEHSSTNK